MTSSEQPASRGNRDALLHKIAVATMILLAGFALLRSWNLGQSVAGIDYYQFWAVGEAIEHHGVRNPYADDARTRMGELFAERAAEQAAAVRMRAAAAGRSVLETYSTPFLYALVHALASGDYERDYTRWHALSLLALAAGMLGLARGLGFGWLESLALLAGLAFFAAPLQSEAQVANVNQVQFGALVLALVLLRRSESAACTIGAGALLGCLAMFKPNVGLAVVFVLAFFALRRELRAAAQQCAGLAAGVLLAFASSSLFFGGMEAWWSWLETIQVIPSEIIRVEMGNYAPLPFLVGAERGGYAFPFAVLLCAPVAWVLVAGRDEPLTEAQAHARLTTLVGLGCVVFLLSANLVWEHYFVLALPLLIAVLHHASRAEAVGVVGWTKSRVLPGLALMGVMATPTFGLSQLPHEIYFPAVQGSAALVLYGLGIGQLNEPARRGTA